MGNMIPKKDNQIIEKSLAFSIALVQFCELLRMSRNFVIADQLLRSGTSIGANVFEAQHSESLADFIHKMKVAMKEASETEYWLILSGKISGEKTVSQLQLHLAEIVRILSAIIYTSKLKLKSKGKGN